MVALTSMRGVPLALLLLLPAFGQAQDGEHSVDGVVRNALTGEPVRNALVFLSWSARPERPAPLLVESDDMNWVRLSGPGGDFHFDNVPDGQYTCDAQKPGFERVESDEPPGVVIPHSSAGVVQIGLTPLGDVKGKIVNQYGEPVQNTVVTLTSVIIRDGERIVGEVASSWTDHWGVFGMTRISPGKYYVKATRRRGGTETHFGLEGMRYAPWESISPVYFGGAAEIESATPVVVAAGGHARADFHVEIQPDFRIRGRIERFENSEPVKFELIRGREPAELSRAELDTATGQFQVLDVTPGAYKLRATQGETRAEVAVNVADADARGVSMVLLPPVTIKVSVHSVGAAAGSEPPEERSSLRPNSDCVVSLHERLHPGPTVFALPQDDGQSGSQGVFPGEYRVDIVCPGGYPVSASFGATDLLTEPSVTISSGAAPPIEIEFKPGGGSLAVKFANPVPPRAAVLLVPASSASAGPVLRVQLGGGTHQFAGLAPGDYTVYGLSDDAEAEFRNPAFLQSLSGGTSVHIEDGQTTQITLTDVCK